MRLRFTAEQIEVATTAGATASPDYNPYIPYEEYPLWAAYENGVTQRVYA